MQASRKRFREPRSCQECRRRKVKCDRKDPCCHCVLSKTICSYGLGSGRGITSAAGALPGPAARKFNLQHVSGDISGSDHVARQQLAQGQTQPGTGDFQVGGHERSALSTNLSGVESEIQDLRASLQRLEQQLNTLAGPSLLPNAASAKSSDVTDTHTQQTPLQRLYLNKSRFFGQTHWTNATYEFQRTAEFFSSEVETNVDNEAIKRLKLEIRVLIQKCKLLARNMKASRPSRCFLQLDIDLPTRDVADHMARLYASRFESTFRILHVPSFQTEYERHWEDPSAASPTVKLKVRLVMAIGCGISQSFQSSDNTRLAVYQTIQEAQNWVSGPMEKDRVCISGLQIQCLIILARQTVSFGGDLIWIAVGTLLRTAIQMGLHRDPKHFAKLTLLQGEIRRRLWATIIELNLQASLDAGMPPNFSLNDSDTEMPSNVDDADMKDSTKSLKQYSESTVTDVSVQRFLFGQVQPRLETLHRMNGLCSEMSYEEVLAQSSKASTACWQCRTLVKRSVQAESEVFRHNMVDLHLRRFLLCLHRPWTSRTRENPRYHISRKISFDSAAALLSPRPDEEFSRLLSVGGGMFKSRAIHVSLALASELLLETEEQGMQSLQEPSRYKKMLIEALTEARSQLAQRIKLGETNVRLYVKLGIVLSQVVATETGMPLRHRMAQSAKDGLEEAYTMIQAYSGLAENSLLIDESTSTAQNLDQQDLSFYFSDFDDLFQSSEFTDEMFDTSRSGL